MESVCGKPVKGQGQHRGRTRPSTLTWPRPSTGHRAHWPGRDQTWASLLIRFIMLSTPFNYASSAVSWGWENRP